MANFTIECPKCGSINQASTFVFAKKVIVCGHCGEEINIKESRLISKQCPSCKNTFVYDQAKPRTKCPVCGDEFNIAVWKKKQSTDKYKMVTINCPQCACACELKKWDSADNESNKDQNCPICGCVIDVEKEYYKSRLVSDTGVSVIQYEGDNSTFVWKHPIEDFNLGSQLVVHESQEAIFFLNGEALDAFGPGRHTLETENLPVLKKIYSLPTGNQTPFHAEIYFVNLTVQMAVKWGTPDKVRFIDPLTGAPLQIGAYGKMNLAVSDGRKLLIKLIGTMKGISWDRESNGFTKSLESSFRPMIANAVKTNLSQVIKANEIDLLEIDSNLDVISDSLRQKVSAGFEEYGLTVPQLYVTDVLLPEEDPTFKRIRELHTVALQKKVLEMQAEIGTAQEESLAQIAEAARQRKLIEEQTKAQLEVVKAQGEAEASKAKGLAEAEVMRAKGYSEKDVLQADVQKAYAEGLGKMGSGGSGGNGGGLASDLVGLMAGMKIAGKMFDQLDNASQQPAPTPANATPTWTCECGEIGNTKGFCMDCGKPKPSAKPAGGWNCPHCGENGITSKFCPNCGTKRPEQGIWECPACGAKGIASRFCPDCGAKKPE